MSRARDGISSTVHLLHTHLSTQHQKVMWVRGSHKAQSHRCHRHGFNFVREQRHTAKCPQGLAALEIHLKVVAPT